MALNKVEICGVDTSKLPLLKEDEKKALFARIKQGDQEARLCSGPGGKYGWPGPRQQLYRWRQKFRICHEQWR